MEKDLEFLINSLSLSDSPLWSSYSKDQLIDMRESFVTLQQLLRHYPKDLEQGPKYPVRVKAGGNTVYQPNVIELSRTKVPQMNLKLHTEPKSSMTSLSSDSSSNMVSSSHSLTNDEKQEVARQADDETSSTDNFLALVPYQEQDSSQELVRYENDDSDTLCASSSSDSLHGLGSDSGARSIGSSSVGEISFSIELPMEYVWHNIDYKAESTDSEMTIKADGFKYILNN
ncbi:uncharacterized protein LOC6561837 [Drosophila grimshawi]|uniref:GH10416 n=1 Tax=Drosophila grimshawi TaxID=7222 RepID=B4JE86_DROGR|nr:uncharacterized protein LOC6561837 [Drosophila grimshawi]EDW03606.1 GH10416 [Drosophila grimshawi]